MCAWGGGLQSTSACLHKVGFAAAWVFLTSKYLILDVNLGFFLLLRVFGKLSFQLLF